MSLSQDRLHRSAGRQDRSLKIGSEGEAEKKQYTIKGIDTETLDRVRAAAGKEGMKVGAWIAHRLKQAASRALDEGPAPVEDQFQVLRVELEKKLETYKQEDRERLIAIQDGLAQVVRAQHSMMSSLLAKENG